MDVKILKQLLNEKTTQREQIKTAFNMITGQINLLEEMIKKEEEAIKNK